MKRLLCSQKCDCKRILSNIGFLSQSSYAYSFTGISEEERKRLLHCVVIGGGPTGVEFSGELSDFIMKDVRERYTHVKDYIKVTLIEVLISHSLLYKFILFLPRKSIQVIDRLLCTLLEQANEILSSFEVGLRQYATNHLTKVS